MAPVPLALLRPELAPLELVRGSHSKVPPSPTARLAALSLAQAAAALYDEMPLSSSFSPVAGAAHSKDTSNCRWKGGRVKRHQLVTRALGGWPVPVHAVMHARRLWG